MAVVRPTLNTKKKPVSKKRLAKLWQVPVFLISLVLFGYAAYLFIDPKPGLTVDQKILLSRNYLNQERADAAIETLNKTLTKDKLDKRQESMIHLMLAEALSVAEQQKDKKIRIPRKHEQIIEQTKLALAGDVKPTYEINRRLAESYEALHKLPEALKYYRAAMEMDTTHSIRLHRKVIDLYFDHDDIPGAERSLVDYNARKDLTGSEKSWAMGELAHIKIDRGSYTEGKELLAVAAELSSNQVDLGQINFWQGYCAWKLGDHEEAERIMRLARDQMHARHPLDGDAAYVLGRMAQDKKQWELANSFYEVIVVNHPDSRFAPLARLGRGVCRIATAQDDAGLTDLHNMANRVSEDDASKEGLAKFQKETLDALKEAGIILADRGNYKGAVELLGNEQGLRTEVTSQFLQRVGQVYERMAARTAESAAPLQGADKLEAEKKAREQYANAGDAYIAYALKVIPDNDKEYGEGLWHGIDLYDKAGELHRAVAAMKMFVNERPSDPIVPEALYRLGREYQALGMFDEAIESFQRNLFRHPTALASSKSSIPLAQCYMAKGTEFYPKAERTLNELLGSPLITPEATEFKQALFELAQLYYRTNKFEEAISKLEEHSRRYPQEENKAQLTFLMGDSYRKSALLISKSKPTSQPVDILAGLDPLEAIEAKRVRLSKALTLYDQAIELYRIMRPRNELNVLYEKLAYFYKADCAYDLASYSDAIRHYNSAAFAYPNDPSALTAYVQIVNSYCAMNKFAEARAANERAKVLLKKMSPEAFADGAAAMPREYWQEWLKWTGDSGIWK